MHVIGIGCTASPKLKLEGLVGDGPTAEAVSHGGDKIHRHKHPCIFGVAEGVPVARVRHAVVVFL